MKDAHAAEDSFDTFVDELVAARTLFSRRLDTKASDVYQRPGGKFIVGDVAAMSLPYCAATRLHVSQDSDEHWTNIGRTRTRSLSVLSLMVWSRKTLKCTRLHPPTCDFEVRDSQTRELDHVGSLMVPWCRSAFL